MDSTDAHSISTSYASSLSQFTNYSSVYENNSIAYNMNHTQRGHAVIINNRRFNHARLQPRSFSDHDAANMHRSLKLLGFKIKVHNDKTEREIRSILHNLANAEDHTNCDAVMVVILSYGDVGSVHATDKPIFIDDITAPFKKSMGLAGKPKIFIFQTCALSSAYTTKDCTALMKGEQTDGLETDGFYQKWNPPPTKITIPVEADFLILWSTIPATFESLQSRIKGSIFISSLCEKLESNGRSMEFNQLFTRVVSKISDTLSLESAKYFLHTLHHKLPIVINTCTKELYFNVSTLV